MTLEQFIALFIPVAIILSVWDAVWKGIGMRKAAKNNHLAWFVCIFIFNTLGILPIIYLTAFRLKQKKKK